VQFLTAMGGGWWNWKDHAQPQVALAETTAAH
jgi:hypothetical protein